MPGFRQAAPVLLALVIGTTGASSARSGEVSIAKGENVVNVLVDGSPFATLNLAPTKGRPYWHPLHAPGDVVVTDTRPSDHLHHTGLYIGVEHVNGVDYWGSRKVMQAESVPAGDVPGKVVNKSVEIVEAKGDPAKLRIVNHWIGKDGKPVLSETTNVAIHANRLMAFDVTLAAVAEKVTFDDTKEGFFAVRLPEELTVKKGSGQIVNPAGETGEPPSWGKTNAWLDYHGEVEGKSVGVALFDHPGNFRKSRYHVRAYGLFAVSPFGEKIYSKGKQPAKPVHLAKGESLRLRYAAFVHAGDTQKANVAGVHAAWAKGE